MEWRLGRCVLGGASVGASGLLLGMVALVCLLGSCSAAAPDFGSFLPLCPNTTQAEALSDLYHSTGGPSWKTSKGWLQGNYCTWFGVECDGHDVTLISLPGNNLSGPLPDSIGAFPRLMVLDLSDNYLSGSLPPTLGCLSSMTYLMLSYNAYLTGPLPTSVANLPNIQHLEISSANLTGNLPPVYSQALRVLKLNKNQLSGTFPEGFSALEDLCILNLAQNSLTGSLPATLDGMKSLQVFHLTQNRLNGTLPESIGNITQLVILNLDYNEFEGELPTSLYDLVYLKKLLLAGNYFSGELSASIDNLKQLEDIDLSRNSFTGSVPSLQLVKLQSLDLSTCEFSGTLPDLTGLIRVEFVDLSSNLLEGSLPEVASRAFLTLSSLDLSSNQLSGTVPAWVSNTTVSIFLNNNNFLCPFPSYLPPNVHVDEHCVSGLWYQGVFFILAVVLETAGFVTTAVFVTFAVAYIKRPALLSTLMEDEGEMDVLSLEKREDRLLKTRNTVAVLSIVEILLALLLFVVGCLMLSSQENWDAYRAAFIISIPLVGLLFAAKGLVTCVAGILQKQSYLLWLPISQLLELLFIPWTIQLEGIAQANSLSTCVVALIAFDAAVSALSALEAYYIQDQYIPQHMLELDDSLQENGWFGEVQHGRYLGVEVAVKRAQPNTKKQRKSVYKAFLREAKLLGELGHHPNVVKLIGISPMMKHEFYIVMEYCNDGNALAYLSRVTKEQGAKAYLRALIKVCMGVCDGMYFLHSKGYVHRDITASNILVKRGKAKLGDLGLAKRLTAEEDADLCLVNMNLVPPDLLDEDGNCVRPWRPASDVYSFGVALWEMLTLTTWGPDCRAAGTKSCLKEVERHSPVFAQVLCHCWHEDPAFRPTFSELLEDFTQLWDAQQFEESSYRLVGEPFCSPVDS